MGKPTCPDCAHFECEEYWAPGWSEDGVFLLCRKGHTPGWLNVACEDYEEDHE